MSIESQESVPMKLPNRAKSMLAGLVVGGLVGAGTMLLLAPQPGVKTRAEVQQGAIHLRDQASGKMKDTLTQAKSKADQVKADVKIKVGDLRHQGQDLLVRQLDRVTQAAETGKKALLESQEHKVV